MTQKPYHRFILNTNVIIIIRNDKKYYSIVCKNQILDVSLQAQKMAVTHFYFYNFN